jgi:hypothetical protein
MSKPYTLSKHDRERQAMLLPDPHIVAPPPPPLPPLAGPQPSVQRSGGGLRGTLEEGGVLIWACDHRHRSQAGALTCSWRERAVELQRRPRGPDLSRTTARGGQGGGGVKARRAPLE